MVKVCGELLLWISLYLGMQVLVTMVQGFVYRFQWIIFYHYKISPRQMQAMLDKNVLMMLIISALLSLFIYWRVFKAKQKNLWRYCRFSKPPIKIIPLAILLGISFNLFFIMLDVETSFDKLFPDYGQIIEPLMSGDLVITLIVAGILIPIFEEILFRGMVLNRLKTCLSATAALWLQGFLFGVYHLNILQGIYGMILGILAGLIYEWFRSIWVPIALHAAFNTFSIVLGTIGNEKIIAEYAMILLAASVFCLGMTIYWLWKKKHQLNSCRN